MDLPPVQTTAELRERSLPQHPKQDKKLEPAFNYGESHNEPSNPTEEKEKKTFGRTTDGTIPHTHDMVSQLLSPKHPKNWSDAFVLAILALHILALFALPSSLRVPVFATIFLFWRTCYNLGIGYLLRIQSNHRRLVFWAKKSGIFEDPDCGKLRHPILREIIKRELETKLPHDYEFEKAPIEYNTWLLFRRVVDLILLCDFVSYCLFAIACASRPADEGIIVAAARWLGGLALFGFNLWVKLDAHRVVKDYAWYWGDFFFLIDQELTFDGVFEMAPHPMYSVGYAGYYGISLMAASYTVLFISILAHAAQFAFLIFVENPHIEKIYNKPPPRRRLDSLQSGGEANRNSQDTPLLKNSPSLNALSFPSDVHNLIGIRNIDFFRVTDTFILLLLIYMFFLTALTPSTPFYQVFFVINAALWRMWYSVGIGFILNRQSEKKWWTRHFLKFGESTEEAWRQWKGLYHMSMIMSHASFIASSWKMYTVPHDWGYGLTLLKHVLGIMLVTLQAWTAFSIYDSLGEFGWFFGDFFFVHAPKLTYSGIYRYLNNPERVIGLAGIWGAVLITGSIPIFLLALMSHIFTLASIQFVERPHMQKLYGRNLRREAGLVRSLRRSLPPPLKQWQGNVDKVLGEAADFFEDFIESARPKFAAGVDLFVKDTTKFFNQYPARISLMKLAPDLAGFNPSDYSLEIEGTAISALAASGKEMEEKVEVGISMDSPNGYRTLMFEYGTPIKVKWSAPHNHSRKDWIGLYMVVDNPSRVVTRVASAGRWTAVCPVEYDSSTADEGIWLSDVPLSTTESSQDGENHHVYGEVIFSGDKLWWTQGVFEFRYHHDGNHSVMSISLPFEVRIPRFNEDDAQVDTTGSIQCAVEKALLPVVRNCFDRDPEIAPQTSDEFFGSLVERDGKYAKRVVFAVHQMFGIEFAPGVVQADGTVKKLAWRICNAKKVLHVSFRSNIHPNDTKLIFTQHAML
ncbi:MAG: phosphatidylethanolamine N-methyltransferase [Trizodia sp. TS-e1964]|nr:MAG: phosphatidylethanolamine N-methyltransferase [Trizodia sp. TS-e1964]